MKDQFDFKTLKTLFEREDFKFTFDGMNGISGPYAKEIFGELLKCNKNLLKNCEPKPDFGGVIFIKLINFFLASS